MKNFFKPTSGKIIFTLILFLVIPMFGTVKPACLAIGVCDSYSGFIGIPALFIFGGFIDLMEAWNRSSNLGAHIIEYLSSLFYLVPYLLLSYVVICIPFSVFRKRK